MMIAVFFLLAFPVFAQIPANTGLAAAFNAEASRAENIGAYSPNSRGVYPVRIRWQNPAVSEAPAAYHIYRSENPDADFLSISAEPIPAAAENGGFFTYIDQNPFAVPGKLYYYRILPLNSQGQAGSFSEICMGYGALSHEQYMLEFNKTAKSSYSKLVYMHKSGALSKLGTETKTGSISGSVHYRARIAGLGGRVTIHYDNYADFYIEDNMNMGPYFALSGDSNTRAAMNLSGSMDGVMRVTGMYPGTIYFDNLEVKNAAAGGGTYGVEPAGFSRQELSWKLGL